MLDGELLHRNPSSVLSIEAKTGEVVQNEFVTEGHTTMWAWCDIVLNRAENG